MYMTQHSWSQWKTTYFILGIFQIRRNFLGALYICHFGPKFCSSKDPQNRLSTHGSDRVPFK